QRVRVGLAILAVAVVAAAPMRRVLAEPVAFPIGAAAGAAELPTQAYLALAESAFAPVVAVREQLRRRTAQPARGLAEAAGARKPAMAAMAAADAFKSQSSTPHDPRSDAR
ncbi:MAG TPA: hypothetical protein VK652_13570, partial [Steroidobacteraceae bacterium]|nr:hypothetical protein [Steroidobacteraceae bacterium]